VKHAYDGYSMTWKFLRFVCSQYDFNVFARYMVPMSMVKEFEGIIMVDVGLKVVNSCSSGTLHIFTCSDTFDGVLFSHNSQHRRQKDRRQYHANSRSYACSNTIGSDLTGSLGVAASDSLFVNNAAARTVVLMCWCAIKCIG